MNNDEHLARSRRKFMARTALLGGTMALQGILPAWARSKENADLQGLTALSGQAFSLNVAPGTSSIDGQIGRSILINGHLPAPLLRWREGDEITLNVTNHL